MNDPTSFSSSTGPKSAFFSSLASTKVLAEASAKAIDTNPYLALAKATIGAASKVAFESSENLFENDQELIGTISLVVSSTLTTTKNNLFKSITKSTPNLFASLSDSGLEVEEFGRNRESSETDMDSSDTARSRRDSGGSRKSKTSVLHLIMSAGPGRRGEYEVGKEERENVSNLR